MGLFEDLTDEVDTIFRKTWTVRDGQVVPEAEDLKLSNDAVKMKATVLYADLVESTKLVDKETSQFSAEIYKTYLHCASKLIVKEGGVVTAFDGDRVMGVFITDTPNTDAARCALKINYAVDKIINPGITKMYAHQTYSMKHAIGIDVSELFIARTGVRGSNDLVWVGRAANYAAKLCSLRDWKSVIITKEVYDHLLEKSKSTNGVCMWDSKTWQEKGGTIYGSNWTWKP